MVLTSYERKILINFELEKNKPETKIKKCIKKPTQVKLLNRTQQKSENIKD